MIESPTRGYRMGMTRTSFFYDVLPPPTAPRRRLKVRSMVGSSRCSLSTTI